MNIRKLKKEEVDDSIAFSEFSFQYTLTDKEKQARKNSINPNETYVTADDENNIYCKMTLLPLNTYIQGIEVSTGGIAGVATWPEYRRQGHVKRMIQHVLGDMRQKKQIISLLHPFSVPFYRKLGWELYADQKKLSIHKDQLPKELSSEGKVIRIGEDYKILNEIYHQFAINYNGIIKRDEHWWKSNVFLRFEGHICAYYDKSQVAQGYILYRIENRKMFIKELIAVTSDAKEGLWQFISNHDSMVEEVHLTVAPDDQTMFFLDDPKVNQTIYPYFMARIVDVKNFLELYPFDISQVSTVLFHVHDDFCPWNTGTYVVHPKTKNVDFFQHNKEGATCQHNPRRGISCSIQSLTAMLLNYQKPSTLHQFNRISGPIEEIHTLDSMIPNKTPFIYDFF